MEGAGCSSGRIRPCPECAARSSLDTRTLAPSYEDYSRGFTVRDYSVAPSYHSCLQSKKPGRLQHGAARIFKNALCGLVPASRILSLPSARAELYQPATRISGRASFRSRRALLNV